MSCGGGGPTWLGAFQRSHMRRMAWSLASRSAARRSESAIRVRARFKKSAFSWGVRYLISSRQGGVVDLAVAVAVPEVSPCLGLLPAGAELAAVLVGQPEQAHPIAVEKGEAENNAKRPVRYDQ